MVGVNSVDLASPMLIRSYWYDVVLTRGDRMQVQGACPERIVTSRLTGLASNIPTSRGVAYGLFHKQVPRRSYFWDNLYINVNHITTKILCAFEFPTKHENYS